MLYNSKQNIAVFYTSGILVSHFSLLQVAIHVPSTQVHFFLICLKVELMVYFNFKYFKINWVNSHLFIFEADFFRVFSLLKPFLNLHKITSFAGDNKCQNYLKHFQAGIWDATHEFTLFHIDLHTVKTQCQCSLLI